MHVIDQVKLTGTAVLATSAVSCWSCGVFGVFAQSPGAVRLTERSVLAGENVPLLCIVLFTVTLNAVFACAVGGALTVTLETFSSEVASTAVVAGPPLPLLFAPFESLTCCWSIATDAEPLKSWFEWLVQVTDHVLVTGTAVLITRLPSCCTWVPLGAFVQSAGVLRLRVESTFTGVTPPLLCSVAVIVTLNAVFVFALAGDEAVTLETFTSDVPVTAVVALPCPLLFVGVGSLTWSWSTATLASPVNWWLEGELQVTDQVALTGEAVLVASAVLSTACVVFGVFVQSAGTLRLRVASALTGPAPLLCRLAATLTLNAVAAGEVAGAVTVTALTLRSACARIAVVALPLPLSFPGVGSLTWSWSMLTAAEPLKAWFELLEQLTDQVALTGAATLGASAVSCTVCAPPGVLVQSPGTVRSSVVSVFTGFTVPLLWMFALTVTLKEAPALAEGGAETEALLTLTSDVAWIAVEPLPEPLLFKVSGSFTCSMSSVAVTEAVKLWFDGFEQVTDHV